jgi:hypothetical protein
MEISTLLTEFRSTRLLDTAAPYLWSDTELLGYLDQAQIEYFNLTGWVIDDTSPFTTLAITAGQFSLRRDASIIRILTATLVSTGCDLAIVSSLPMVKSSGPITKVAVDQTAGRFVLDAVASQNDTLRLRVERAPVDTICNKSDELEVPARHQRVLMDYMEYLAYKKPDNDTQDLRRSVNAYDAFAGTCARLRTEISRGRTPVLVTRCGGY